MDKISGDIFLANIKHSIPTYNYINVRRYSSITRTYPATATGKFPRAWMINLIKKATVAGHDDIYLYY